MCLELEKGITEAISTPCLLSTMASLYALAAACCAAATKPRESPTSLTTLSAHTRFRIKCSAGLDRRAAAAFHADKGATGRRDAWRHTSDSVQCLLLLPYF